MLAPHELRAVTTVSTNNSKKQLHSTHAHNGAVHPPHDNCKIVIMMISNKIGESTICIVKDDVADFAVDVTRLSTSILSTESAWD